jgi:hypothetical protein
VRDGSIDKNLLSELESEASANPSPTAVARVVAAERAAAQFEISVGDFERAVDHYNVGLRYDPNNAGLLMEAAYLHLREALPTPDLLPVPDAPSGAGAHQAPSSAGWGRDSAQAHTTQRR